MNDTMEKPALALAIVEKKPQRPAGCVGIFFRLFDWNQRFAKKNIFPKKFLPPVRFKQTSKKFGGAEKQPKLRLIADENNGGFPNAKISRCADNEQKHEMRVPGVVARLMGLESMPTLHKDKPKKKVVCGKAEVKREELSEEKGGIKHEVRPQKIQKTSVNERQSITKFGAEKLPFKNVLSKSRKHHNAKLPSPVKNPKNLARKRPSKLIGAATRILEPGLQTSRSKCALAYSNTSQRPPKEVNVGDSYGFGSVASEGESSCRNCGYLVDNLNGERRISSKPLVFASCYHQLEDDFHVKCTSCKNLMNRKVPPWLNATNLMNRKASTCVNRTKNSVSWNQRLSHSRFELEKRINSSMNGSVISLGRKRRPTYFSRQAEDSGTLKKPIIGSTHIVSSKQMGHNVHYCHHECDNKTFDSSVKQKIGVHEVSEIYCDGEEPALVESGRKTKFEISGDALSALLEQKLKELGQRDNRGNAPRKTTSMIVEELITSLKMDVSLQQDNLPSTVSQGNTMNVKPSFEQPIEREHLSPGSVLELFHTESCPSSSAEDSLGYSGLLDSAASLHAVNNPKDMTGDIVRNVSEIIRWSGISSGSQQIEEVLLKAELAFHHAMLSSCFVGRGSPIKHLLLDEVGTLASILWKNFGCSLGGKDANQLKRFVVDAIMEYLGDRFRDYPESKVSRKLLVCMKNGMLMKEIVQAVRRWGKVCKLGVDELIEREMDDSLGEWSRGGTEAYESGIEITKCLVDEIVMDVCRILVCS